MSSFWQILDLDAASATEKDAKIAYARLIKLHRPDTDPLGFQRVREAYEIALTILRQQSTTTVFTPPADTQPASSLSSSVATEESPAPSEASVMEEAGLPAAVVAAEAVVARARESGDEQAMRRSIGSLFAACGAEATGSALIRLWQESLHRATDGRADLVVLGVSVPQLLSEIESGSSIITHACISCWESAHDLPALLRLAEAMILEPQRANNGDAAIVGLRLALEIAFAKPAIAQALSNLAFPHLDREARDRYMPEVDRQAHVGSVFAGFRHDQFDFWHQRFRRPSVSRTWQDPMSETAIEYLVTARARTWEGVGLIQQIAPDEWFQRLEQAYAREPAKPAVRSMPEMAEVSTQHLQEPAQVRRRHAARRVAVALVFLAGVAGLLIWQWQPLRQHLAHGTSTDAASWSLLAVDAPTSQRLPVSDRRYAEGSAQCLAAVHDLRAQHPAAATWADLLGRMYEQAAVTFTPQGKLVPERMEAFRAQVQTFFKGIARAESDPMVEQHTLELLLLDPAVPDLVKKEAISRQQETLVPSAFLPGWQLAASSSVEAAKRIGIAATWFLAHKGQSVSLDSRDRDVLTFLAHELPADAMADTTDATAQR